jgi:hypothetical protein
MRLAAAYDAEYGAGLSNHLPMALVALVRLGATGERLATFRARYAHRLHAAPPMQPWSAGDPWRAPLGDPHAWPCYRTLFRQWIADEGAPHMLPQVLPALMQGVGAAAFHGAIRCAYALAANHADELADGLAYWACRWFECGAPTGAGTERDPARLVATLALDLPGQPLISQAMAAAAADPRLQQTLARLHVDGSTLARLAQLAAERHAAHGDFTTLHLVTSAHAMSVLLPWLDDDAARGVALAHYAGAWLAAWATLRRAEAAPAATVVLPWDEIVARAIESDDEHCIKLVDSCRELEATFGGAQWHVVASRAVA